MNIILTPAIPGGYQYRQSLNKNLDELTYLNRMTDDIILRLRESVKHTPFITITKLAGLMDQILTGLQILTRTTPPTSNCLIAVGLNSTRMDGHQHSNKGWRVISNPESSQSSTLATALATAAIQILGHRATSNQDTATNLAHLNQTPILTAAAIPAVLTLNLYQDNRQNAAYLLSSEGRQAIISLHVKGISAYLERLNQADSPATYPTSSHRCRMHQ
jgi:N-acetylmuramoyl-L-alanine amidase